MIIYTRMQSHIPSIIILSSCTSNINDMFGLNSGCCFPFHNSSEFGGWREAWSNQMEAFSRVPLLRTCGTPKGRHPNRAPFQGNFNKGFSPKSSGTSRWCPTLLPGQSTGRGVPPNIHTQTQNWILILGAFVMCSPDMMSASRDELPSG